MELAERRGFVLGVTSRGPLPPLGALSRQWQTGMAAGLHREGISAVRLALQSADYRQQVARLAASPDDGDTPMRDRE
jgi:hypothetical protein